jgi:8-oxo-dGTP pyrophosphatase MutT (NUDIX family)
MQKPSAAVAIIKCLAPEKSFLVIRRATHPDDPWSGHYSFPGGRKEKADRSLLHTCIRETREEVGISLSEDQLESTLPVTTVGRNLNFEITVQPFLFVLRHQPPLNLEPREVQSSHWLKEKDFRDTARHREIEMLPRTLFSAFPLGDYYLWGFTYKLLKSILGMGPYP